MTSKIDHKEDIDRPVAVIETNLGTFEAELYAKECPETVGTLLIWPKEGRTRKKVEISTTVLRFTGSLMDLSYRADALLEMEPEDRDTVSKTNSIRIFVTTVKGFFPWPMPVPEPMAASFS